MTVDMSTVIVPKSDQWNADDFIAGPQTFAIEEVVIRPGNEQPVSIRVAGSDKAYRPCKSMSRVLVAAWGPDAKNYTGRSLTLFRDPTIKWGGLEVGGIRISHMSNMAQKMVLALTATKGSRKPYVVQPLTGASQRDEPSSGSDYTLSDARNDLRASETLEALKAVWQSPKVARYRDELKSELEELKAAFMKGRPVGVNNLNFSKDKIDLCLTPAAVDKAVSELLPALLEEDGEKLRAYALVKISELESF